MDNKFHVAEKRVAKDAKDEMESKNDEVVTTETFVVETSELI